MKLTTITTAKNAAATIDRTLRSLAFADERIVIVDEASTDLTKAKAKQLGARVLISPWRGFGQQKNVALEQARGDWVLFIDADEVVPPLLAKELLRVVQTDPLRPNPYHLFWLRIVTVFLGQPLKHLFGHNPRLFRRGSARWTNTAVHEQIVRTSAAPLQTTNYQLQTVKLGDPDTGLITAPIVHYSHATIRAYIDKMHRYTDLDAAYMRRTGRHRSGRAYRPVWWLPPYLAARQLVKLLCYRRGILDGYAGVVWCVLSANYEWEMASKYRQLCA